VDQFATTYASVRKALLARHFAHTKTFPAVNLVRENLSVATDATQGSTSGDNPLSATGKLLVAMAAEYAVDSPYATDVIRHALASLGSLFRASGSHFDGYPLRWDPVSSDAWVRSGGQYASEFLFDDSGYVAGPPAQPAAHALRPARAFGWTGWAHPRGAQANRRGDGCRTPVNP
jgi:hypothetical protein